MAKRILVASPICKSDTVLSYFFNSLERLNEEDIELEYCFVDDNTEASSQILTQNFCKENRGILLFPEEMQISRREERQDHNWTGDKIQRVAYFKNKIIEYFLKGDWDYIFFVDSDLVLHPNTIQQLIKADKDIVANIFWTIWPAAHQPYPQVWLKDFYTLYDAHMLRQLTEHQQMIEEQAFLAQLRQPGVYRVGGLGACTLIKRNVLEKGVHFGEIYNLSFWGEDRSFCIRAVALGFELFVDTHYPAYHIFSKDQIDGVEEYIHSSI